MNSLFQGQVLSEVNCLECKKSFPSSENSFVLCLDIPQVIAAQPAPKVTKKKEEQSFSLQECLESFFKEEHLGSEYSCGCCKKKTEAKKKLFIRELPEILVIQLKRFCWKDRAVKIQSPVDVPFMIDLLPFTKIDPNSSNISTSYQLTSVVVHKGVRMTAGHYTTYCFNREINEWVHFNDSRVQVVSPEEVSSAQAYLLFFERQERKIGISPKSVGSVHQQIPLKTRRKVQANVAQIKNQNLQSQDIVMGEETESKSGNNAILVKRKAEWDERSKYRLWKEIEAKATIVDRNEPSIAHRTRTRNSIR